MQIYLCAGFFCVNANELLIKGDFPLSERLAEFFAVLPENSASTADFCPLRLWWRLFFTTTEERGK